MATIPDKVNTGALATILVVGAISMIGISAALTALVRSETQAHGDAVGSHANLRTRTELARTQEGELTAQPAWSDRANSKVSLPIERAMELVVEDLRKYPEHATAPAPRDAAVADPDAGAATGEAEAGAAPEGAEAGAVEGTPAEEAPQGAAVPEKGAPSEAPAGGAAEGEPKPKAPAPKAAPKPAPAPAPEPPAPDPGSQ
jgi:hypothetical protein